VSRSTSDLAKLALLLRADPLDVLRALGGPWYEDSGFARDLPWGHDPGRLDDDADLEVYAHQFVGRVGPSVVLRVNGASRRVLVGRAAGHWDGPGALVWEAADPATVLEMPVGGEAEELERFLRTTGAAVDEAARAKAPTLVTCRYCGAVIAPEHALDRDTCYGCGSELHGIVY